MTSTASHSKEPSDTRVLPEKPWNAVLEQVTRIFEHSSYSELKRLSCQFHEGVLTLRGRLPCYYLKQIAQTLATGVAGVEELDNRIEIGDGNREKKDSTVS